MRTKPSILDGEIWRPVVGWESSYAVSNLGRVKSLPRTGGKNHPYGGNVLAPCSNGNGYMSVHLREVGRLRRSVYIHRMVLEAFVGPCPDGMWGHNNGVRSDCRLTNLRWDTPVANHADKRVHGTIPHGDRAYNAVLTAAKVNEIRASGLSDQHFAKKWNINSDTIRNARVGTTWKHLTSVPDTKRRKTGPGVSA